MIPLLPPLSLYIHIPWCVRKCPYCDFNSHEADKTLPIEEYIESLKHDLLNDAYLAQGRKVSTIFFGGGTPSLFPGKAIGKILRSVNSIIGIETNAEITLEANPGTTECFSFDDLFQAGVNRLSIGVQSFNNQHLSRLGRIHNEQDVDQAYLRARKAGFDNINIDLMHGLSQQTIDEALNDLERAINLEPKHISWYQLTIEPNTVFYTNPPLLPVEDVLADIQDAGQALLLKHGFFQYEVSAYAKPRLGIKSGNTAISAEQNNAAAKTNLYHAQHNVNYWRFGDYLGIGAGAHSKITERQGVDPVRIIRRQKTRSPKDYLDHNKSFISKQELVAQHSLPFEFMINALRLNQGVESSLFTERTNITVNTIALTLSNLKEDGLLEDTLKSIVLTPLGRRFLNSVLERFM